MIAGVISVAVVFSPAKNPGHGRNPHGTPTPSPTPSPSTTPPSPTPNPTPTATPLPPPPTVTLAWDPVTGVTGYNLKLGFLSGAENAVTNVGNVTTWSLTLTPATTYYFVVTAYNDAGESPPSNEVVYTTP